MTTRQLYKSDRPREKLVIKGQKTLNDLELIQIIIGTDIKGADIALLSKQIHKTLENNNGKISIEQLVKIRGVSMVTASKLVASLELANTFVCSGVKIKNFEDILPLLINLRTKTQEHFVVVSLDGAYNVIAKRLVDIGILNATMVHPREVFSDAVSDRAACVIVAHNHPSGSTEPSKADIEVTRRLMDAGNLLGIPLLDHIIVTHDNERSLINSLYS